VMVYALDLVDAPITCHAWNADGTQLALCANTPQLFIYQVAGKKADVVYTLSEHTQVISSVDWNLKTGQLVTCSHDRNAYVWTLRDGVWTRDLVILRLKRAATYVRWNPDGTKFAVATGTDKIRVCAWMEEQHWWQSVTFSTEKPTSLTADFAPDGQNILVSCTDRHCRYITIDESKAVQKTKKGKRGGKDKKYMEFTLAKFPAQGWVNCSALSPSGAWAAYASQDSYIRFVPGAELAAQGGKSDKVFALNVAGLPFLAIHFLSDVSLIAAGFDCQPRLFWFDGAAWTDLGFVDNPSIREAEGDKGGAGMASRLATFGGKVVKKTGNLHQNIILGIRVFKGFFSTCANDGRIGIWPLDKIKSLFGGKNLGF